MRSTARWLLFVVALVLAGGDAGWAAPRGASPRAAQGKQPARSKAGRRATTRTRTAPPRPAPPRPLRAPLDRATQRHFLAIILEGSMSLSKTVARGYSLTEMPRSRVRRITERNFRRTAKWLLANAHELSLSAATARDINQRLRDGMVGEEEDRQPDLRSWQFLDTRAAERQLRRDPIGLAERIHTETQGFNEAFFDANGRTARLMADLALIKAGRAPALYPDLAEYARTASPLMFGWSQRERIQRRFPALVERGEHRLAQLRAAAAEAGN